MTSRRALHDLLLLALAEAQERRREQTAREAAAALLHDPRAVEALLLVGDERPGERLAREERRLRALAEDSDEPAAPLRRLLRAERETRRSHEARRDEARDPSVALLFAELAREAERRIAILEGVFATMARADLSAAEASA